MTMYKLISADCHIVEPPQQVGTLGAGWTVQDVGLPLLLRAPANS